MPNIRGIWCWGDTFVHSITIIYYLLLVGEIVDVSRAFVRLLPGMVYMSADGGAVCDRYRGLSHSHTSHTNPNMKKSQLPRIFIVHLHLVEYVP